MFRFRPQLVRQLGLLYIFQDYETSDDPHDTSFTPDQRTARMMAIIEQHPDTGIADVYRHELNLVNAPQI